MEDFKVTIVTTIVLLWGETRRMLKEKTCAIKCLPKGTLFISFSFFTFILFSVQFNVCQLLDRIFNPKNMSDKFKINVTLNL